MMGRVHVPGRGRLRSKIAALTLAVGVVVPGAFIALTPSSAGAQGTDPLGPTIAQLEQTYATAYANVIGEVGVLEAESSFATELVDQLLQQPGCLILTLEDDLGLADIPPAFPTCIL